MRCERCLSCLRPKSISGLGKRVGVCRGHSHHRRVGDVVTFLMVFLIQNTQNRDAKAVHLKLDEIIRALKKACDELADLEELSDEELGRLEDQFRRVRTKGENHGTNMRHVEPEVLECDR